MELLEILRDGNVDINHGFGGVTFSENQVNQAARQISHSVHWSMIAFLILVIVLSMVLLQPLKVRWAVYCGVSSVRQRTIANRSLHRIGRPFIHLMCYAVLIHTLGSLCDRSCWSVGVVGLARCARSSASRRLDGARRQPAEQKELDGWRKKLTEQVPIRVTHPPHFLAVIAGRALTNRRISPRSFPRR